MNLLWWVYFFYPAHWLCHAEALCCLSFSLCTSAQVITDTLMWLNSRADYILGHLILKFVQQRNNWIRNEDSVCKCCCSWGCRFPAVTVLPQHGSPVFSTSGELHDNLLLFSMLGSAGTHCTHTECSLMWPENPEGHQPFVDCIRTAMSTTPSQKLDGTMKNDDNLFIINTNYIFTKWICALEQILARGCCTHY